MYSSLGPFRPGRLSDSMAVVPAHSRQRPGRRDHYEDESRSDDAETLSDDEFSSSFRTMRRRDSRSASERIPVPVLHASHRPHLDANDVYVFPTQTQRIRLELHESGHRIAALWAVMGGNMKLREVEQQLIGESLGRRARLRVRAGRQGYRSFPDMRMNELVHNAPGEIVLVLEYGSRTSGRRHESVLDLNYC
ncbi:hypothetical protein AOQ84DRAFT_438835 [Glonium stellatum]|uniref:Uncharacterized protein n=1 Tax=Glonium stellatum TaxID=574774 RepID=A0A8E2JU71_9PEZI|nr:hypothetical protein AOQ84DRAFT_438835 [Glonium stellatum]